MMMVDDECPEEEGMRNTDEEKGHAKQQQQRMTLKERRYLRQVQKQDKVNRGNDTEKRLDTYIDKAKRDTIMVSKMPPDELFEELKEFMWLNNFKQRENPKKYRLTVSIVDEDQASEENEDPVITIEF